MKLGLVTYNMAKDWDIDTIIKTCAATGFEGVELRTTHAHGVEVTLSADERKAVKKRFADSPIELCGLGSAFEYHAIDEDELRRNIEGTKEYAKLAYDVGAPGIKVRPNGLQEEAGIPKKNLRTNRTFLARVRRICKGLRRRDSPGSTRTCDIRSSQYPHNHGRSQSRQRIRLLEFQSERCR
jgi:sugar phosphate isomerase/epimerase